MNMHYTPKYISHHYLLHPVRCTDEHFWNIGIRIEDDALVTNSGCELLTRKTPVEVKEIESVINK